MRSTRLDPDQSPPARRINGLRNSGRMALPDPVRDPISNGMSEWINSTLRAFALLALLLNGMVVGAHRMSADVGTPAAHAMHMIHAAPQDKSPDPGPHDPVCKQHCMGAALPSNLLPTGHDPAARLDSLAPPQAQVAGLRLALPDPPPKTAV